MASRPQILTSVFTHSYHVFLGLSHPLVPGIGRSDRFDTGRSMLYMSIPSEPLTAKDCCDILNAKFYSSEAEGISSQFSVPQIQRVMAQSLQHIPHKNLEAAQLHSQTGLLCQFFLFVYFVFLFSSTRSLLKQCLPSHSARSLQCFELIMVHVGLVTSPNVVTTNPFVQRHFRRLAMKLWEATGEANSPISLLWGVRD